MKCWFGKRGPDLFFVGSMVAGQFVGIVYGKEKANSRVRANNSTSKINSAQASHLGRVHGDVWRKRHSNAMPYASKTALLKECEFRRNTPPKLRFRRVTPVDCDCRQRSHDRGGGPSEEAITPEISPTRRSVFWKFAAVPLKTVQAAGRAAIDLLALTSRTCTVCTVLESKAMRNRKYAFDCGETVQDQDCLWKGGEKRWPTFSPV